MNSKFINYAINQLSTDEESRERFVQFNPKFSIEYSYSDAIRESQLWISYKGIESLQEARFEYWLELYPRIAELFIRTCLSRIDGKAVLRGLEESFNLYNTWDYSPDSDGYKADYLYQAFDYPLRNGQGLEKALEALDKEFLDLNIE